MTQKAANRIASMAMIDVGFTKFRFAYRAPTLLLFPQSDERFLSQVI